MRLREGVTRLRLVEGIIGLRLRERRTRLSLRKGRIVLRLRVRRSEPPRVLFRRHFLRHEHSRDFAFWYMVVPELPCDFVVSS